MRLTKLRKSKSSRNSDNWNSVDSSWAIVQQLVKVRVATAVLVAAVALEHARADISTTFLLAAGGVCAILITAVIQTKLTSASAVFSIAMAFLDSVIVLAILAAVGAESTDAMLLILALPLVHVAVAVGVGAMTVLWVLASFAVMTWSVWTWDSASQPVTEAALTLIVLWIVAYVSGIVTGLLAQRTIDFGRATIAADRRSDVLQVAMLGCLAVAGAPTDAYNVLCIEARRVANGKARIAASDDRFLSREFVARATASDGAAVVGRDAERNCHIAVALGRSRFLVVVAPPATTRFQIDAIELLALQLRACSQPQTSAIGPSRRRSSDPASATLAEALDTSVLELESPLGTLGVLTDELPSPFELLGRDDDALARTLLFGPTS